MVASASGIRAGAAYVEITADDAPMVRRLRESQARLRQWVAENSGPALTRGTEAAVMAQGEDRKGFLSGGFRGMQFAETGLRFATAVQAARVAIKDVQIFSRLFRGDLEGARKAAEALPFGLGEIVKELSGPVDSAARNLVLLLQGKWNLAEKPGAPSNVAAQAKRDRDEAVDQWNRYCKTIDTAQEALARATMTAREYAAYEVAGMGRSADEAARLLALKLQLIEIGEQEKAFAKLTSNIARGQEALKQAGLEYQKLTLSSREFLRVQVQEEGYTPGLGRQILALKLAILDVTEEQARAENRAWVEAQKGIDIYQEVIDNLNEREKVRKEGQALEESLRTPEERAKADIEKAQALLEEGVIDPETYSRAVRKAVEDAAAAMPDAAARATIGVRGTFNAMEAAGMGAGGVTDRIASATEKTAKNTEKIAQLAANLGVTYQ